MIFNKQHKMYKTQQTYAVHAETRIVRGFVHAFAGIQLLCGILLLSSILASCDNIGLGDAVDTEAPTCSITSPAAGSVVNGTFTVSGACNDDEGVSSVKVTVVNTDTGTSYGTYDASVSGTGWSVSLNSTSADASSGLGVLTGENVRWSLPDGKYSVSAVAYDAAGRNSGTASRAVEIDNTPPILVLSKPSAVGDSDTCTAYGATFTLKGTVIDGHTINTLKVLVYDSSKNYINTFSSGASYVAASGSTSINELIASFSSSDSVLQGNYIDIYGADATAGTKKFFFTPVISDAVGNSTSSYFFKDDLTETAADGSTTVSIDIDMLQQIIENTYSGADKTDLVSYLNSKKCSSDSRIAFSLNPKASPSYSTQYRITSASDITTTLSRGSSIGITASLAAGDSPSNITPSTFETYIIGPFKCSTSDTSDSSTILTDDILSKLYTYMSDSSVPIASVVEYVQGINTAATLTKVDHKSYSDGGSGVSTDTAVTYYVDVPEVRGNKAYVIAVRGQDDGGMDLQNTAWYGFKGIIAGSAPELSWGDTDASTGTNIEDSGFYKSSALTISGTANTTESGVNITNVTYSVTVTDETKSASDTGYAVGNISGTAVLNTTPAAWSFSLASGDGYDICKAAENSGKQYLYSITVTATDENGMTVSSTRKVHVDTIKPVVSISSISPIVSKLTNTTAGSYTDYVNGTFTVSGTVEETYLDGAAYTIKVNGTALNSASSESLGTVFNIPVDTTADDFTDGASIEVVVTAVDKAGNTASYSSTAYNTTYSASLNHTLAADSLYISQETDKPSVTFTNADGTINQTAAAAADPVTTCTALIKAAYEKYTGGDSTVKTNIFGTTSNNFLYGNVTDDDGVAGVSIGYRTATADTAADDESSYTMTTVVSGGSSTSASFQYKLPAAEGLYDILVKVTDTVGTSSVYNQAAVPVTVAVDTGAPVITVTSTSGVYYKAGSTLNVQGTVSDASGTVTLTRVSSLDSSTTAEITVDGGAWTDPVSVAGTDTSAVTHTYTATDA